MNQSNRTGRVIGTGKYLPETTLDNRDLYEMESIRANFDVERARASLRKKGETDDLSPEEVFDRWSRQVTGIRERPILPFDSDATTEDMCARASRRALENAGLEPGELDLIVAASVTPADEVPNLACTLARDLGAPSVPGFTVNAACAGFVYAMSTANSFVRAGTADRVLAVTGDALTRVTDYTDPKTAVLFSDGAGCAVLEATGEATGIRGEPCLTADYNREHLYMATEQWTDEDPESTPGLETLRMGGGPRVLRQAINAMVDVADGALATTGLGWEDIHYVVPHQANLRITRGLEKKLSLPGGKVVHTIEEYGNSSASTVSIAFDEVARGEHGPLPDPTRVVLTAVGGGYTSGGMVLEL